MTDTITATDPAPAAPAATRIAPQLQNLGLVHPDSAETVAQVGESLGTLRRFALDHGLGSSLAMEEARRAHFGAAARRREQAIATEDALQRFKDTGQRPDAGSPEFDAWRSWFFGPTATNARAFARRRLEELTGTARKVAEELIDATDLHPTGKTLRESRADETPAQKRQREAAAEVAAAEAKTVRALRDQFDAALKTGDEPATVRKLADRLMSDPSTADLALDVAREKFRPRLVADAIDIVRRTRETLAGAPRLLAELQRERFAELARIAKLRDELKGGR